MTRKKSQQSNSNDVKKKGSSGKEEVFYGIPVSPGFVIGKAFKFENDIVPAIPSYDIKQSQVPLEIARFETALIATRKQILDIQKKISEAMGTEHAEIFNAHLLVIEDRVLIEEVIKILEKELKNIEHVFLKVSEKYGEIFSRINDEYLRERASDIKDVTKRVLSNLMGQAQKDLSQLDEEVIVVAHDISPSDTALMHRDNVIGFATDIGGPTSHTAIMARTLDIPAVVGLHDASKQIKSDVTVIIDGNRGTLIVNPSKQTLERYGKEKTRLELYEEELAQLRTLPAQTQDGYCINIAANIEMPEDVPSVMAHGAQGIGLYRTEFFYMNRRDLPTEDEHYEAYFNVAKKIYPNYVIIRTVDLGGDKFLSQLDVPQEMNPYLGWRAIRFCLAQTDFFKVQLRAILRASSLGNIKMMYPMISGIGEVRKANALLEEVKQELSREGISYDPDMEVGAMIEVPSAALTADIIAKEVDFFSVGTNDLIQYSMAVDRVNERIAYLYEPSHPAILRLIKYVVDIAHKENIWVGVCGEMASEPALALMLIGLGIDELSCSSVCIPELKRTIRSVSYSDIRHMADSIFNLTDPREILNKANELIREKVPGFLQL
ncbi:MAG: phosphoenolpyruvate--protein phosphotransferase [Candidatus Auribacter fodinae]|jgi:phosphotransferase system enzyme I (PtsI)|uniref:Phosphoenolpyruvate-protein phosphotransferase n=1 Tax=Candidatus Auribacter fodinae TaxID=2093366 RepID=A0A3A4QZ65_9BACT|nr:MAG: phosphoenolpyruvate--protein phosphotransferase [Candidatus Auribacter fodinae]